MTTSRNTPLTLQLENNNTTISPGVLAYLSERARNSFFQYILEKFEQAKAERGLTQSKLADRIGKTPDRISRLLNTPGNLTIDTYAELLAGISAEEPVPNSRKVLGRGKKNISQGDIMRGNADAASDSSSIVITFPNLTDQGSPKRNLAAGSYE